MRYDVHITMTLTHLLAVEAESPILAQGKAFEAMANKEPDKVETHVEVEVGNG